jgi:hypothetical protein
MDVKTIHNLAFKGSLLTVLIGTALGLTGIWYDDFWKREIGARLLLTTFLLFCACTITAAVTHWLAAKE